MEEGNLLHKSNEKGKTMGFLSGVGNAINDVLGGTSSAKKAQHYQLNQMAMQNKYNERYAQNAHQWEIEDLKKAGLNPVLSAGGSTAGAIAGSSVSSGGNIGSTNGNITDLFSMIGTIADAKKAAADTGKTEAETASIIEQLPFISKKQKAEINNLTANTVLRKQQTLESKANTKYTNERARGFSESSSESKSTGTEFGGGISMKGINGKAGHNSAKTVSHSRTW